MDITNMRSGVINLLDKDKVEQDAEMPQEFKDFPGTPFEMSLGNLVFIINVGRGDMSTGLAETMMKMFDSVVKTAAHAGYCTEDNVLLALHTIGKVNEQSGLVTREPSANKEH